MPVIRRLLRRVGPGAEDGFTMIAMVGVLTVAIGLSVAAFAAAGGDLRLGRYDQDSKQAYAAAEAGIHDYLFHLNEDNTYWTRCDNVPAPAVVNQPWNGVGTDPRRWRNLPSSQAQYAIEVLPANGATQCQPANAQASMIDAASGTFRVRSTGRSRNAKRSIVTTFRRRGFLDYLYFTDYETADPTWYEVDTKGRQTNADLTAWGSAKCPKYWRQGRGNESYDGQIFWFDNRWQPWSDKCTEIQFAPGDVIAGPFHTNDEILVCGSPDFGRSAADHIEVSGPGWRGSNACGGNNPTFIGTWSPNSPTLSLPPSDSSLRSVADPAYRFTGRTTIRLNGNTMTVNGTSMALPANGVVYVQNGSCGQGYRPLDPYNNSTGCGDVYVKGTYSSNLTIASEKDIIIDGDITRSGDVLLGLIANNFVRVYHPVSNFTINQNTGTITCDNATGTMQNVRIDAAMLSLQHSFTVDNYYCGNPLGTLTVNGVIGQKFRGPVGRGSGNSVANGYTKNYQYDDRLRFRSPPHFLDPVQSSWKIARFTEQTPPR